MALRQAGDGIAVHVLAVWVSDLLVADAYPADGEPDVISAILRDGRWLWGTDDARDLFDCLRRA